MSVKQYKLFCTFCHWTRHTDGSDLGDLIQKKIDNCPGCGNKVRFKCPQCGRLTSAMKQTDIQTTFQDQQKAIRNAINELKSKKDQNDDASRTDL